MLKLIGGGCMIFIVLIFVGGIFSLYMGLRYKYVKNEHISKQKQYMHISLTVLGVYSILCSIVGGVYIYLKDSFWIVYSICLWVGGLVCALGILQIVKLILCTQQVKATCTNYYSVRGAKGGTAHFARISYKIGDEQYISTTDESYLTLNRLKKHYERGKNYTIWIYPKYPNLFVTDRKIHLRSIILIVIGFLMIFLPIYSIVKV